MSDTIKNTTEYLFNCNFSDDSFDPEGDEKHLDRAYELMEQFSWNDIVSEWLAYLYNNCRTEDEVINFANLFMYYGAADEYVPEPYKFLGYLYANVDLDTRWDDAGDLFDSIAIGVLSHQLLIDIVDNPYYNPLKDEHILAEVTKWKNVHTDSFENK